MTRFAAAALTLLLAWVASLWWPVLQAAPLAAPPAGRLHLVDNQQCLSCHGPQAQQWQGSRHAHAMAPATAQTVLADFNNTRFVHLGQTTRFLRRGERFIVNTEGPDGKLADFEVGYTFGVEPLQQYLLALPGGRWQALQVAWDTRAKKWFALRPELGRVKPGDVLHWSGRYQNANTMCIACHTTGFEKRYDPVRDVFNSRWHETKVSCQACHGPGSGHVQWAKTRSADPHKGLDARVRSSANGQQVEMCASCHSRRGDMTDTPDPRLPRLDHQLPSLLTEGLYHPDGQQLDEVFEDGSFRQSRMHQMGVGCTDCHNPHSGRLKANGNALCLQCHAPGQPSSRFPSASGDYDSPRHHHHPVGSAGAQCIACHMPGKTYMRLQERLDHSLRVPRPDLSVKLGLPNACTQCHSNRSPAWAAEKARAWWGEPRKNSAAEALIAARTGRPEAAAALASDLSRPALLRATALYELRQAWQSDPASRIAATRDPDPEVRAAAALSLESADPRLRRDALLPLLQDPLKAVRLAAVRNLVGLPIPAPEQARFNAVLAEYEAAQQQGLDLPDAHLNLAVLREQQGRPSEAVPHYRGALRIDPDYQAARLNLARVYAGLNRSAEAEALLREGIKRQPEVGDLHYSLGLLLAETPTRLAEAAASLERAARLLPKHPRIAYNLALAHSQLGRRASALNWARKAASLAPENREVLALLRQLGG